MVKKSALQFTKDKTFKVISSLSGGFVKVVMLNDSSTTYSISNNSVRPIPLTPEILEKNGWKRTQIFIDDDGLEFHTYIDDERCLDLQYYPQYKKFAAFICKQEVLSDIEYVHQLQHLLFGLGLPMDLKV